MINILIRIVVVIIASGAIGLTGGALLVAAELLDRRSCQRRGEFPDREDAQGAGEGSIHNGSNTQGAQYDHG